MRPTTPTFIAVKSGTLSKSLTLVPLAGRASGRDYVRVDRAKGEFKKAPSYDTDVELTLDDEAETFKHYGLEYAPAGSGARRLAQTLAARTATKRGCPSRASSPARSAPPPRRASAGSMFQRYR